MFFGNSLAFFYDPGDFGNLISGSSAFSKSSLCIWKFLVHILLKPSLKDFEHYFSSMWNECNCAAVWTFFGIALLWDWNDNWPFPVLWPLLNFPNLLACYWVQHLKASSFRSWDSSAGISSPLLTFFVIMLPEAPCLSRRLSYTGRSGSVSAPFPGVLVHTRFFCVCSPSIFGWYEDWF